ncbi:ubiquitin carboxyl-terminal hydrolase 36 [Bombus terrestris]|uniref:Ubiquitin carboxyl-terminal hydrolase n=1 Tax=Bombus terrestris TaxID=30195 RepID=A0A6P3TU21_BOMTE|nr:ubiquitin carboxyl-terminal hydrolase 36 [Bombus terrestris]XP_012165978.1 ubiquitin carboxyl-terminal hydrolase 36 [Bombus terrestris]XP_012165980.1 ubiquitin carboxyl-terminal hydrolase 36 [Bombus terrestris]
MPAVSICDPVAATLRRTLETNQSRTSDDLTANLVTSASRILQSEIQYKEVDDYQTTILDQLKAKYIVLSLPNSENSDDKMKDGANYIKKNEKLSKELSLPEPTVTLYSPKKVSLGWKGTFPVGAGMYNVGNTCYLNSTLQALFHVPALVNWLLSDSHHTSKCEQNDGGGECLTCAVAKTLQSSHQKSGCAIKPFYIYNKLKLICRTMVPGQQEDAHEFLRYLLEGMEKAYLARHKASKLDSYSKETTPINQIFGGYIRTEVKCLQCRHVSTTFQHFQDLLVDIRKASTLDEALSSYFSREQLDNNDYKCEACKRRVPATKQFSLERPPKVLCVQLKRFSVLGGKISKHIGFKQTIDMGPYLWKEPGEPTQSLTYKLMSIVTHMGPSVNCGHYTAVAKVSTGQYYSFDDSCVRPLSLSNVFSTNAYIMIFEMEQQTQSQVQAQQTVKLNGTMTVNNTLSPSGSPMNKTITPKASTSGLHSLNGLINGTSISKDNTDNSETNLQISTNKNAGLQFNTQKSTNFIGPQLPQKLQDKSQPRLIMHIKNGKILNGNSLVPYDGSSEEEDVSSIGTLKNHTNSNTLAKTNTSASTTNGTQKCSQTKNGSPKVNLNVSKTNGSSVSQNQSNVTQCTKTQNGSSCSTITSTIKYQNGKSETNGKTENSNNNSKNKWHQSVRKTGQDDKVITKASSSSMKGWQVSKDTSFSATSTATPNGWSVTDKEDIHKISQNNSTPSAAALRDFNGTNRSDTVSHLLKMSHRGYGSSSVANWNGNRTHLDREVDNDRREERKRHFNADDEEIDRGRVKKVKDHRTYEERSNSGYNPFQEYQNGKTWNRSLGGYYRRHYYNTSNNARPRHGRNYRPPHYRYHNHSRAHWQRE